MDVVLASAIVLYSAISVLFAFLAYTYGKTWLSTKARYPLGLLIFSLLLLLHSAGTAIGYGLLGGFIGDAAYPFMFGMAGFELAGVAALLRTTL